MKQQERGGLPPSLGVTKVLPECSDCQKQLSEDSFIKLQGGVHALSLYTLEVSAVLLMAP